MVKLFTLLCQRPRIRKRLWRILYQLLAACHREENWSFMNYGYQPLNPKERNPNLIPEDLPSRYSIQLYTHLVRGVDLSGLCVLEVGSGRGGGSSYIKRYLHPGMMVGLDYATKAIAFSKAHHCIKGLYFVPGDAESLPFRSNAFDAVINLESSHCYGSMGLFLAEVRRVLKPGGYFLYADFRARGEIARWCEQLRISGFSLLKQRDITANVLAALDCDEQRKLNLIRKRIPRFLEKPLREFAALQGSRVYRGFRAGDANYMSFVLKK